jgi:hypothetical protein
MVDLWNETFGISFFEVRSQMKRISHGNFTSIKHTEFLEDAKMLDLQGDKGSIVVFTDDDDWIDPDIFKYLSPYVADYEGFTWGSAVFGKRDGKPLELREIDGFCYTNNYAVALKNIAEFGIEKSFQHFNANITFKKIKTKKVDRYLSITNKHPGSTLFLEQSLKDNFSSRALIDAIRKYLKVISKMDKSEAKRNSLGWAFKYMFIVKDFFEEVIRSRKV